MNGELFADTLAREAQEQRDLILEQRAAEIELFKPQQERKMNAVSRPLYEIDVEYMAVVQQLIEDGGEWTPETEAALAALEGEMTDKLERIGVAWKIVTAEAMKHKAEAVAQQDRARILGNTADRLKNMIYEVMKTYKLEPIKSGRVTLAVQKSGGKLPVECELEGEDIPDAWRIVSYRLNTELVRAAADEDMPLPDGVRIGERGTHLRIK